MNNPSKIIVIRKCRNIMVYNLDVKNIMTQELDVSKNFINPKQKWKDGEKRLGRGCPASLNLFTPELFQWRLSWFIKPFTPELFFMLCQNNFDDKF